MQCSIGECAIRHEPMTARPRRAGSVVPADVAPNEPLIEMRWLRGKSVQVSKIP